MEENSGIEIIEDEREPVEEKIKILHKVEAKETLYAISKIYNVEVMDIVNWNNLNIADGLSIDQVLEIWTLPNWQDIPANVDSSQGESTEQEDDEEEDEKFLEYRVQPGDNSISIGERIRIKR